MYQAITNPEDSIVRKIINFPERSLTSNWFHCC